MRPLQIESIAAVALLLAVGAGGCVRAPACPPRVVGAEASVLACHARQGDKLAQLELGKAVEPTNPEEAARLYRAAAAFSSGTTYVYSPPVGEESSGRVVPVRAGSDQAGLAEAKYRLAHLYLEGRGVQRDRDEALELLTEAAQQGYAPASATLRTIATSDS